MSDQNSIDNIDLKINFAFTLAYEELYERGDITDQQLDLVLSLIDNLHNYSAEEFEGKLKEIFI